MTPRILYVAMAASALMMSSVLAARAALDFLIFTQSAVNIPLRGRVTTTLRATACQAKPGRRRPDGSKLPTGGDAA